jgi:hypothetical protein
MARTAKYDTLIKRGTSVKLIFGRNYFIPEVPRFSLWHTIIQTTAHGWQPTLYRRKSERLSVSRAEFFRGK